MSSCRLHFVSTFLLFTVNKSQSGLNNNHQRFKRVVGGEEVLCGIQIRAASLRSASNSMHLCGATILSPNYALTAAHCVDGTSNSYYIQLNNYCTEYNNKPPSAVVLNIIKHSLYKTFTYAHDIALLKIQLNLTGSDAMLVLKDTVLPNSSFGITGECTIYGYGHKNTKDTTTDTLHSARLKLVSLDECSLLLGQLAPGPDSGMLCAIGRYVDACQGDSGGPLICSGYVEGLSSYGVSCGVDGLPGVYVSVGAHLEWLKDIIQSNT